MSLVRSCLRACLVITLKGQTQAGYEVHDSAKDIFDGNMKVGDQKPIISVYTDEDFVKDGGRRHLNIVVEVAIARSQDEIMRDNNGHPLFEEDGQTPRIENVIVRPETDASTEFIIDQVCSEMEDALVAVENDAANVLRAYFLSDPVLKSSQRAVFDKGEPVRFAARQLFMTMPILKDWPAGSEAPDNHPVMRTITLMEQDDKYKKLAQYARDFATRQAGREQKYIDMSRLGISRETAQKIRLPS